MSEGPSLIQQRIALDRLRTVGVILTVTGGALLLLGLVLSIADRHANLLLGTMGSVLFFALGVSQLIESSRRRRRFEREHGRDAGRHKPVGR